MSLNQVKAVTFDFEGTLARVSPSVGHVYSKILIEHGIDMDPVMASAQYEEVYRELNVKKVRGWDEMIAKAFEREVLDIILKPYEADNGLIFQELWDAFRNPDNWKMLPYATDVIKCLYEQSYTLAICSNFDSRLKEVIKSFGWDRYISRIYLSTELEAKKPSATFYKQVEKKLKLRGENIVHVGNDFSEDYLAAKRMGWHAVAFQPEQKLSVGMISIQALPELVMMLLKTRNPNVRDIKLKAHSLISNLRALPAKTDIRLALGRTRPVEYAINAWLDKNNIGKQTLEKTIMQHWKAVVGPQFAHRCRPQKIVDNKRLVMVASNAVVRQEILFQRMGIINRIRQLPGCKNIEDLILRAG